MSNPPQARFGKRRLSESDGCRLYFIAGAGLIKIGVSTNLTSRLRAIRNSSPVPVELIASIPGGSALEGILHSKFAKYRRHGEWFEDCDEIRQYISRKATTPALAMGRTA